MLIQKRRGDSSHSADCLIVGGGLIGMSIALELHHRDVTVILLDHRRTLVGASIAAAGMLAVNDPHNPPAIQSLSQYSAALYPSFLQRIADLSGIVVPFQTDTTVQHFADGSAKNLVENSIDPRQLASALRLAVASTPIQVLENTSIATCNSLQNASRITTSAGDSIHAAAIVCTAGAWTASTLAVLEANSLPVTPRKGQMLRVKMPTALSLREVHRSEHVYIVPRSTGHQVGSALIGATVEDAGFNTAIEAGAVGNLRRLAAELLPDLASQSHAPLIETWTGLRPCTPDLLPIIGELPQPARFIATGHYRNGILLAPATAAIIADLIQRTKPKIEVAAFSPLRFSRQEPVPPPPHSRFDIRAEPDDNCQSCLR
ncbi:MAG: FAD-dependent oxidoreductase [Acidobacteria bacterium]|nr:FAD-dependent oxidoreductase [Acidobacteriota bacterium]